MIAKRHLYIFRGVGSAVVGAEASISKFFSSLMLGEKQGIELTDGPGEQSASPFATSNDANVSDVFAQKDVSRRPFIILKPEPSYTDEARRKKKTGTVQLRALFSSSGLATNIDVLSSLPFGLTEKAIAAAKQIRYIPAIKDGRFVAIYMQLDYNFNLYYHPP
jgi:TonB family protein